MNHLQRIAHLERNYEAVIDRVRGLEKAILSFTNKLGTSLGRQQQEDANAFNATGQVLALVVEALDAIDQGDDDRREMIERLLALCTEIPEPQDLPPG